MPHKQIDTIYQKNQNNLPAPRALIVMPESKDATGLRAYLLAQHYDVLWARDGEAAYNILDRTPVDALITYLDVHRIDGMRLLRVAKQRVPDICAVMIADRADVELATEAVRQGAYDFQSLPLNLEKIGAVLDRGIAHQNLKVELTHLQRRMDERFGFQNIVGHSEAMRQVYRTITQIAPTHCTVLICGETGTGKELVAQALHQNSPRKHGPLVRLNCGALSENLVESELFGHERGAFTGAVKTHHGRFEAARGGTLFLDEVGEVSPATQVKLLRVLETGEYARLGSESTRHSDARVIAATNRDLPEMVRQGTYRLDLYHRLNVVRIEMPPLRERKEDLPLLVERFISELNPRYNKQISGITRGAMNALLQYDWPGNVRELKNVIEGMIVFAPHKGTLDISHLPNALHQNPTTRPCLTIQVGTSLQETEKLLIGETLCAFGHDKPRTAHVLGIGLRTLYRKIKLYELE